MKAFSLILTLLLILGVLAAQARAEDIEAAPVLVTFREWKETQILESQNSVVRLSNRIHLIKTGRYKGQDSNRLAPVEKLQLPREARLRRDLTQKEMLADAELELKKSLESLQYAKDLTLDEYVEVYLSQFKGQHDVIAALTDRLSKQELADLIKAVMKTNPEVSEIKSIEPAVAEGSTSGASILGTATKL